MHTRDADRVEAFQIHVRVPLLEHVEFTLIDVDVLSIELGVEPDVRVVRILLEVVNHPISEKRVGIVV